MRDQNSVQIVESLCGRKPQCHIDPVLLYEFPEAEHLEIARKDYIVVYAYADRIGEAEAKEIRKFSEAEGKKILTLGFFQPFCDEYILAEPAQVLAYIKHADYVITDTFHGAVFSIKYQVPFAAIVRESNQQKLQDLLERFGLEDRIAESPDSIAHILKHPMDGEKIRHLIQRERERSLNYLKENLRG